MRVTIVHDEVRFALDVPPANRIDSLKRTIRARFIDEAAEDKRVNKYLELTYGGAALEDDLVVQDVGIISGSIIKCALKTVVKPNLLIYLAYNGEVMKMMESIDPYKTTVAQLKSLVSEKLGLPVSIFRFSFDRRQKSTTISSIVLKHNQKATGAQEIFDGNLLDYYGIEIGSRIRLDLWDGWNELVLAAIAGHEKVVENYFSWYKAVRQFQQRVALYIAADRGHVGLATAMIKCGAKAHEPVGLYPGRKWCFESEHPESKICPLHIACARGHLPVLRLFIKCSPLCFTTTDHKNRTPIQIITKENIANIVGLFPYKTTSASLKVLSKRFALDITSAHGH